MKTRYIGLCLFIVGLLAACSEDELVKNESIGQPVQVKVKAHSGSDIGISTRLAYTDSETSGEGVIVTWSAGDAFYLKGTPDTEGLYAEGQMNILERETYTATEDFSGVLSRTLVGGESVTAYYPSSAYDPEQHLFNIDLRKMTQNATDPMGHLSDANFMVGTGTVNEEMVTVDFKEGNKVAIVRFDLTVPAQQTAVAITELQIESENLHTIGTLSAESFEFTEDTFFEKHRQIIFLEGYIAGTSETKLSVYAIVLPTTLNQDMKLNVAFANGDVYSSTVSFSTEASVVACNRYYIVKEIEPLIEMDYTWYTQLGANASNYVIENENQLFAFAQIVNGTSPYKIKDDFSGQTITLKNDIVLNVPWKPIGASYAESGDFSFKGTFDGDGHTISDVKLYVEVPSDKSYSEFYCGFFGKTDGATIKNLTLEGDGLLESASKQTKAGTYYLGGLLGLGTNTVLDNCRNEMNLQAYCLPNLHVGGIAGDMINSSLTHCANSGNIIARSIYITPKMGGVMGYGKGNILVACYTENVQIKSTSTGSISYLGGIAGQLNEESSTMIASYSLVCENDIYSDAWGTNNVGGLVSDIGNEAASAYVYGCYALMKLWDSQRVVQAGKDTNINVGEEANSETHMNTLNNGIAAWNATLSAGILDPAYCRYSYKVGDTHLVLEKTVNIHSGQLDDMGNGGEIGRTSE